MLEILFVDSRTAIQYCLVATLAVFAWLRGDQPERQIAAVFLSAIFFEALHPLLWPHPPADEFNYLHAAIDGAMFLGFAHVAMRANRMYPLWLLALQLIAALQHFQRLALVDMDPVAYWAMVRLPFYLQMLVFAIGLAAHRRRVRRGIHTESWRNTSHR